MVDDGPCLPLLRQDAAGGNDPTYDLELWETGGGWRAHPRGARQAA